MHHLPTLIPLGGTPLWQTALLDQPWIGALLAAAIGFVAAVIINRAGRGKLAAIVAGAGLLVGGGIFAIGSMVVTTEAMLSERTEQFVNAIAGAEPNTVEPMLAPRFVIASRGASGIDFGADWLISVTAGMDRAITSNSVRIESVEVQGSNTARVRFRCRTTLTQNPGTVGSTWEVQWQRFEGRGPEAWQAVRLEGISIYGNDAGMEWIGWGNRYRTTP
ncbi:MAG: hypothetical protein ACTS3F_04975 [Phycisphaerales bacterium]